MGTQQMGLDIRTKEGMGDRAGVRGQRMGLMTEVSMEDRERL